MKTSIWTGIGSDSMTIVNTSARVRKTEISIDPVALFDVLLIALIMSLASSKFILSPGMGIDIDSDSLPKIPAVDSALTDEDICVVNASGKSMLIFEGEIFAIPALRKHFEATKASRKNSILLIKTEKTLDTQTLLEICSAAKSGGFKRVQIAAIAPSDG